MAKVKCSYCKTRVDKESLFRNAGLVKACSQDCMTQLAFRTRTVKATKRPPASKRTTDGGIPASVRKRVLERDRCRCRFCGGHIFLHVHHVVYRSQGGPHEPWNLITLCEEHHSMMHSDKKRWMPVLKGVIWLDMVEGRKVTVPQLERWLNRKATHDR